MYINDEKLRQLHYTAYAYKLAFCNTVNCNNPAHDLRLLIEQHLEQRDDDRDLLSEMRALVYGHGW